MTSFLPLLLPLETLPGWPTVASPTFGDWLLVLLIIPGSIGLMITLIGLGPTWARQLRNRPGSDLEAHRG